MRLNIQEKIQDPAIAAVRRPDTRLSSRTWGAPRIGSGATGRAWAASAKSGKPDFSSRSFAGAGERGAKARPARPAGTPDKRRREMCACGSPACGGGRVGDRFRASGSGGRSPAKPRHAERPSPGPSRQVGGAQNETLPDMKPALIASVWAGALLAE